MTAVVLEQPGKWIDWLDGIVEWHKKAGAATRARIERAVAEELDEWRKGDAERGRRRLDEFGAAIEAGPLAREEVAAVIRPPGGKCSRDTELGAQARWEDGEFTSTIALSLGISTRQVGRICRGVRKGKRANAVLVVKMLQAHGYGPAEVAECLNIAFSQANDLLDGRIPSIPEGWVRRVCEELGEGCPV